MVGDDGVGSGRGVVDDDVGCKGYKGLIMVRDVVQLQEGIWVCQALVVEVDWRRRRDSWRPLCR